MAIINAKGISPLKEALIKESEDSVKAAATWTLGQLGSHSSNHAKAMAEADVLSHLLAVYNTPHNSEDLRKKAKKALKNILVMCTVLEALVWASIFHGLYGVVHLCPRVCAARGIDKLGRQLRIFLRDRFADCTIVRRRSRALLTGDEGHGQNREEQQQSLHTTKLGRNLEG